MPSHDQGLKLSENYRGPDLQVFFRDLRDPQNRKRKILVKTWSTVQDVKNAIAIAIQVSPHAQRLFYGPLGAPLPNHRTLNDAGIYKHGELLLLDIVQDQGVQDSDLSVASSMADWTPRSLKDVIQQCRRGLAKGYKPELVLDGSGGTYYFHNACKVKVAVFKPADEEPYAENNPRGYVGRGTMREGVVPGKACLREVAAYLLDHGGFCNVPMTTLVEARHAAFHFNGSRLNVSQGGASLGSHSLTPHKNTSNTNDHTKKIGSLQVFVKAECTMDDLSPSKISKDEVHKIALLDIRLMNADRNSANLLCRIRPEDGSIALVPIDHGFCLRDVCDVSWMDWCWLDWPQMKEVSFRDTLSSYFAFAQSNLSLSCAQPISPEIKEYINNIDIEDDCKLLKETLNIQGAALDYLRVSNLLLKEGVKAGLTLYDIAILCCRNDDMGELPSKLEMLTRMASELATSAVQNGRWHHVAASKAIAEQLSPVATSWSNLSNARFFKSASSADMTSFFQHETREEIREGAPGTAPSSVSDASSDVGDVGDGEIDQDECECDEWAASIIAEISMAKKFQEVPERVLREDESTSSQLSCSPRGFWFTKPGDFGSSDSDDDSVNDDSVTWSPHASPRIVKQLSRSDQLALSPPDSLVSGFLLPPASMGSTISFPGLFFRRQSSGASSVHKSQSFAALHSLNTASDNIPRLLHSQVQHTTDGDSDAWKVYFDKFIDLVIAREVTAAAARSASIG